MRHRRAAGPASGITLIEVLVVTTVLAVAATMLLQSVASITRQRALNNENARVADVVRTQLETLRGTRFSEVFARYNDDPDDDPDGIGTAPGAGFDVPGLTPQDGDVDGRVGAIVFPVGGVDDAELREDVVDKRLGMPRDLSGDLIVDALDHATNYEVPR